MCAFCAPQEYGNEMYIIQSGRVEILNVNSTLHAEDHIVCELGEGEVFGESALLHTVRTASARAIVYCHLLELDGYHFEAACEKVSNAQGQAAE